MYQGSKQHKENLSKARTRAFSIRKNCQFCNKLFSAAGFINHEKYCYLNPRILKKCAKCGVVLKHPLKNTTCSKRCSNIHFARRKSALAYRTICFRFHKRKCCICDETLIVGVHHLDENNKNNDPSNLIPMCPTHHQYWHSKHKYLVEQKVLVYIKNWSGIQDLNLGFQPSKGRGDGQTPLMPVRKQRIMPNF